MSIEIERLNSEIWERLENAVVHSSDPHRYPSLATVGLDGDPKVRMVVLRAVTTASRTIDVHTDVRTRKVAELRNRSRAALLFWDPNDRIQIRMECRVAIHMPGSSQADASFALVSGAGRTKYRTEPDPGTELYHPGEAIVDPVEATAHRNFTLLRLQVERIDWLLDKGRESARAEISLAGEGTSARWIVP